MPRIFEAALVGVCFGILANSAPVGAFCVIFYLLLMDM
jgi:hypothetical protein